MKKAIVVIFMAVFVAPLFSFVVPSEELTSKYGISYEERQRGYVEKNGYSFQYIGRGTWDVKRLNRAASFPGADDSARTIAACAVIICIIGVIVAVRKRDRSLGDEVILDVTAFQNPHISTGDIMNLFAAQCNAYSRRFYQRTCRYQVNTGKDEQNYAWRLKIEKQSYRFAIIYDITFCFSNGWFQLCASDKGFSSGGRASKILWDKELLTELKACKEEAKIMWKMHGREPTGDIPFNYYPFDHTPNTSKRGNATYRNSYKRNTPPPQSPPRSDMVEFYRSLLGLKLLFTQGELKAAYREAAEKYHPDRYISASNRDRENAETLMKQINAAYEALKEVL